MHDEAEVDRGGLRVPEALLQDAERGLEESQRLHKVLAELRAQPQPRAESAGHCRGHSWGGGASDPRVKAVARAMARGEDRVR